MLAGTPYCGIAESKEQEGVSSIELLYILGKTKYEDKSGVFHMLAVGDTWAPPVSKAPSRIAEMTRGSDVGLGFLGDPCLFLLYAEYSFPL